MISSIDYCKINDIDIVKFKKYVSKFKLKNGNIPDWCIQKDKNYLVDDKKLDNLLRRKERCLIHLENPITGIYWYLKLYFNDAQIAMKMSIMSRKFKCFYSWSQFISVDMWNIRTENKKSFRIAWSMAEDFLRNGSIELYLIAKRYGIREIE